MADLFELAEQLAGLDHSRVQLDPDRCLHSLDKFNECQICIQLCPVGAIRPGRPPSLDNDRCVNCLACLPGCPLGAFRADDAVMGLLDCVARIESGFVDLVCEAHPEPGIGPRNSRLGIRVQGCLAGLGAGAYLGIAALGLEGVLVRTERCAVCPIGNLESAIESQLDIAISLSRGFGKSFLLEQVSYLPEGEQVDRPFWSSNNPPISRRDLLHFVSRQGKALVARDIAIGSPNEEKHTGRDRHRVVAAMAHLENQNLRNQDILLEDSGFAILEIGAECDACGACARACPTGALQFEMTTENYYCIRFFPLACHGCGICQHVCAQSAISILGKPTFNQIFGSSKSIELSCGELRICASCGTRFPSRKNSDYCSICEFRRNNPFNTHLPSGVQAHLDSIRTKRAE
jgi:ferredoxin